MSPTSELLFEPYENSDLSWIQVHPNVRLPSSLCSAGLATFLALAVNKPESTSRIKKFSCLHMCSEYMKEMASICLPKASFPLLPPQHKGHETQQSFHVPNLTT